MIHSIKIWEKIIKQRISRYTSMFKNQFCFIPRKLTIEQVLCSKQIVEKFKDMKKNLCMALIGLEYSIKVLDILYTKIIIKKT